MLFALCNIGLVILFIYAVVVVVAAAAAATTTTTTTTTTICTQLFLTVFVFYLFVCLFNIRLSELVIFVIIATSFVLHFHEQTTSNSHNNIHTDLMRLALYK